MKKKIMFSMISLVLIMLIGLSNSIQVLAVAKTYYISEIKVGTSNKSAAEAKNTLTSQGFQVLDNNLNEGTGKGWAYMGYKLTDNRDEAITDISAMNMNGGFKRSNYGEMSVQYNANITSMAKNMLAAAKEFCANYKAGSPAAKAAYLTLNTIHNSDNKLLGDYFVDGDATQKDLYNIIMKCQPDILKLIYLQLTLGVTDYGKKNWMERLSDVNPEDYEDDYFDLAEPLLQPIIDFAKKYNEAKKAQVPGKDPQGEDGTYIATYKILEQYSYGDDSNLAELFSDEDIDISQLYPLANVLTPGQIGMFSISGITIPTLNYLNNESDYAGTAEKIKKEMGDIKSIYLWRGVDLSIYDEEIGVTSRADRQMAMENDYRQLTNDSDTMTTTIINIIKAVAIVGCALGAMAGIFAGVAAGFLGFTLPYFALVSGFAIMASTSMAGCIAIATVGTALMIGVILVAVIAVALIIWGIIEACKKAYAENNPTLTKIPKAMYDLVKETSGKKEYIHYDAATDQNEKPADLNLWEGKQWVALYYTKDKSAGSPITANSLYVKHGNGTPIEGFSPIHEFGSKAAFNLNTGARSDKVNGIFLFFKREAGNDVIRPQSGDKPLYLDEIYLQEAKSEGLAKETLQMKGYMVVDYNLAGDNSETNAYIGYKVTEDKSQAITDIRIAYNYKADKLFIGDASYGESGTAYDITLFSTKMTCAGSAILPYFHTDTTFGNEPSGYEPVCLISGGPAGNFNMSNMFQTKRLLYFLPSETYTSGTKYVSGLMFAKGEDQTTARKDYSQELLKWFGYKITNYDFQKDNVSYTKGSLLGYYISYNPYRALRHVASFYSTNENNAMPVATQYCNLGYAAVPAITNVLAKTGHYGGIKEELRTYMKKNTYINEAYFGSNAMYVTSATSKGAPFTFEQMKFSNSVLSTTPSGYVPVRNMMEYKSSPADLKKGGFSESSLYLYIPGIDEEKKYVSDINTSNSKNGQDMANLELFYTGCEQALPYNYKFYAYGGVASNDVTYSKVGLQRSNKSNDAIRGILIYVHKSGSLPNEVKSDGISYKLAGNNSKPIFAFNKSQVIPLPNQRQPIQPKSYGCAYIYTTKNPAAGEPIVGITIDNNISKEGCTTAKYQSDDMGFQTQINQYIHIERAESKPKIKYMNKINVASFYDEKLTDVILTVWGATNIVDYDFDYNTGNDCVKVGYTQTEDSSQAITGLIATINRNWTDTIENNGITYHHIESLGDFNTPNLGADRIYMYYTKDPKAGAPIVSVNGNNTSFEENKDVMLSTDGHPINLNQGTKAEQCDSTNSCFLMIQRADNSKSGNFGITASIYGNPTAFGIVIVGFGFVIFGVISIFYNQKKKRKKENEE